MVCLIVRRVLPTPGSQLALFTDFAYHPFITDRTGDMLHSWRADHWAHAEIENAIRDLKYGVGLNHMPSGRFGVDAAWLAINVIAHDRGGSVVGWAAPLSALALPATAAANWRRGRGLRARLPVISGSVSAG